MTALIPLAKGFEEMEAVIVADILRRGGVETTLCAMGDDMVVEGSRGVAVAADVMWDDAAKNDYDAIIIPGGMGGTRRNQADDRLLAKVVAMHREGKLVAAICAGPIVLATAGVIGPSSKVTCYPGLEGELRGAGRLDDIVVQDGNVITSQGPGTSMAFALAILGRLLGADVAGQVAAGALTA